MPLLTSQVMMSVVLAIIALLICVQFDLKRRVNRNEIKPILSMIVNTKNNIGSRIVFHTPLNFDKIVQKNIR